VHDYIDRQTWENNPLIFFDTLNEYHVYKIFAVFKTSANLGEGFTYHNMIEAKDKADFDAFISKCKDLSFYDTGITPQYGDKVICLSTCEYTLMNGRLVMAAVRIS
jgi:sortase B